MTGTTPEFLLVGETFSPWTKKARWALECCAIEFRYQEYTPTLSEAKLRWQMQQWSGAVSVPVLFTDQNILRGSWEIARFANTVSSDRCLGDFSAIEYWNTLSEAALAEGRTRVVRSILNDNQALEEALPSIIPKTFRAPLRPVARDAVARLDRKYANLVKPGALKKALQHLRISLEKSDNDYLIGDFSYADISMAAVLEVIAPIALHHPPLGTATQALWNDTELAEEYQDLVKWRDRLAADDATSYSQFEPAL